MDCFYLQVESQYKDLVLLQQIRSLPEILSCQWNYIFKSKVKAIRNKYVLFQKYFLVNGTISSSRKSKQFATNMFSSRNMFLSMELYLQVESKSNSFSSMERFSSRNLFSSKERYLQVESHSN